MSALAPLHPALAMTFTPTKSSTMPPTSGSRIPVKKKPTLWKATLR